MPEAAQTQTSQTQTRKLKKGELLFNEGDVSRSMYLLKSGVIRIFKKRGDSSIEIDTIHSGQIIGELAFLDGNPRSASGEALADCDLVEISGPTFSAVLAGIPEWLKIMLKTVVGRLRTASTRIRQLETAGTSFDYSGKEGGKRTSYVYLSPTDVLKLASSILLVGTRSTPSTPQGAELRTPLLNRYANQIMGVPLAKLTTVLDLLTQTAILKSEEQGTNRRYFLANPDALEELIGYLNEENLLDPSKRHDLLPKGFKTMSLIVKHLDSYPKDEKTGFASVNLAVIQKAETPEGGKEPFRIEDVAELARLGYSTQAQIKSADEVLVQVRPDDIRKAYRMQRIVFAIAVENLRPR